MDKLLLLIIVAVAIVLAIYLANHFGVLDRGFFGGCDVCGDETHEITGAGQGMMQIFSRDPWIAEIESGKKTVDSRVGTDERHKDLVGKRVKIVAPGKKLFATVTGVRTYKTLDEYIAGEGVKKIAPHLKSEKDVAAALLEIKNKAGEVVYDPKRVKEKGGITAIEFKVEKK